jgi:glycosyltransferase involved in cell wall biosynthesis
LSAQPEISVLLPVHDAAPTLVACLASIQRQSRMDFECVVVDDGSSDGSQEIARRIAARDGRFMVVEREHEGLVSTLQAGAHLCRAPVIARIDADDWMHRDRLALQLEALRAHPELDAVGTGVHLFPRRALSEGRRAYESWLNSLDGANAVWKNRFIECPVAHPTLAIRREALLAHPYRERGWPEDYDLLLRLLRAGPRVGVVPRRLVGWRDHSERLSRTHDRYALERFTACRAWHLSRDFLAGHREYVLWGHGRTGRALRRALSDLGHDPVSIVEVHPRRIGRILHGAEVIPPDALAGRPRRPLIASVAGAGPRGEIRAALAELGYAEGIDFVCAA